MVNKNANILLNYADLEIYKDLKQNQLDNAWDKCRKTHEVCQNVFQKLILKEVHSALDQQWS